jgi:hypothetical protein
MSLIGDVLTVFEATIRIAVPSLPAGTLGIERGWRPSAQLEPGSLPHTFLWDENEKSDALIFRQRRVSISLSGLIVRRGSTHAQALTDYDALTVALQANPTLTNNLDNSELQLDGVEASEGDALRAMAFTFTGTRVLG